MAAGSSSSFVLPLYAGQASDSLDLEAGPQTPSDGIANGHASSSSPHQKGSGGVGTGTDPLSRSLNGINGVAGGPGSSGAAGTVTLTRKRSSSARIRLSRSSTRHRHSRSDSDPYHSRNGRFGSSSLLHLLRRSPLALLGFFSPSHLTQRARTTNLAVLLLIGACCISFLFNVKFYLHEHPLKGERERLPLSIRATLPQSNVIPALLQLKQREKDHIAVGYEKAGTLQAEATDDPVQGKGTSEVVENAGRKNAIQAQEAAQKSKTKAFETHGDGSSDRPVNLGNLDHLILVAGHAIWKGRDADEVLGDENWVLEEMQKGGSVNTFVKHIMKGVELTLADPKSLLVFSGGQTRTTAEETEGDSYFRVSHALNLYQPNEAKVPRSLSDAWPLTTADDKKPPASDSSKVEGEDSHQLAPLFPRATTEQFALDSYQNLLFSICRFQEVTGRYPSRITVIGFGMKRARFTDVHRAALKFPLSSFTYVGIDDSGETGQSYIGEKEFGLKPYMRDVYGCKGLLIQKRRTRNPFRRIHPYFTSNAGLRDLLEYCPEDGVRLFPGSLPWQ